MQSPRKHMQTHPRPVYHPPVIQIAFSVCHNKSTNSTFYYGLSAKLTTDVVHIYMHTAWKMAAPINKLVFIILYSCVCCTQIWMSPCTLGMAASTLLRGCCLHWWLHIHWCPARWSLHVLPFVFLIARSHRLYRLLNDRSLVCTSQTSLWHT